MISSTIMRIRFFADFCSSSEAREKFEKTYRWPTDIQLVDDDTYTHAVIINTAKPPNILVPKEKVLGMAFEPPALLTLDEDFAEYARLHIGRYLIGGLLQTIKHNTQQNVDTTQKLREPFIIAFAPLWHCIPPSPTTQIMKHSLCSLMVSEKQWAPGHVYRHMLAQMVLDSNLPVDIWGRGCAYLGLKYAGDSRLRGGFTEEDTRIYNDYLFHIAIENFQTPCYVSEKLLNPLLYECTPLYLGSLVSAPEMFGDHYISLTGMLASDMELLREILNDPQIYIKNPMQREKLIYTLHPMREIEKLNNASIAISSRLSNI